MLSYITTHLKDAKTYVAVLLSILGTLMASGVLGSGTALHAAGYVVSVLTVLGFKGLPAPTTPAA